MPDPNCVIPGCIHQPGFVIVCGYDEALALVSVGAGWADLVRAGLVAVEGKGVLVQVKEKFGGLRLYAQLSKDLDQETRTAVYERLIELERQSALICEECGISGEYDTTTDAIHFACPHYHYQELQ